MVVTPDLPLVAKVGHAHAGFHFLNLKFNLKVMVKWNWKLLKKLRTSDLWLLFTVYPGDIFWYFRIISHWSHLWIGISMHGKHFHPCGLTGRIQKIGNHYRGFKRVSPNWKGFSFFFSSWNLIFIDIKIKFMQNHY